MEALVLYGSAKKNGSSSVMAEAFTAALNGQYRIRQFRTADLNLLPCRNCGGCAGGRDCVLQDDMQPILDSFRETDLLIMAAPIYYYGMPAPLKTFLDRLHAWPPAMERKPKTVVLLSPSADTDPRTPQPLFDQMSLICEYRGWTLKPVWLGGISTAKDLTEAHFDQLRTLANSL